MIFKSHFWIIQLIHNKLVRVKTFSEFGIPESKNQDKDRARSIFLILSNYLINKLRKHYLLYILQNFILVSNYHLTILIKFIFESNCHIDIYHFNIFLKFVLKSNCHTNSYHLNIVQNFLLKSNYHLNILLKFMLK